MRLAADTNVLPTIAGPDGSKSAPLHCVFPKPFRASYRWNLVSPNVTLIVLFLAFVGPLAAQTNAPVIQPADATAGEAVNAKIASPRPPTFPTEFTNKAGMVLRSIRVQQAYPNGIVVSCVLPNNVRDLEIISFTELSPEWRARYGYDPKKAAAYEEKERRRREMFAPPPDTRTVEERMAEYYKSPAGQLELAFENETRIRLEEEHRQAEALRLSIAGKQTEEASRRLAADPAKHSRSDSGGNSYSQNEAPYYGNTVPRESPSVQAPRGAESAGFTTRIGTPAQVEETDWNSYGVSSRISMGNPTRIRNTALGNYTALSGNIASEPTIRMVEPTVRIGEPTTRIVGTEWHSSRDSQGNTVRGTTERIGGTEWHTLRDSQGNTVRGTSTRWP